MFPKLDLVLVTVIFPVIITAAPQALNYDANTGEPFLRLGKQTDSVLKKVLESRFMDAVTRIDDYIKFLFEVNSKLKTLSSQLASSDHNVTEIESILVRFTKACQINIQIYLESHKESLIKHPLKTLAESVADALSLTSLGHMNESGMIDAILDRLGRRFATLYRIAQENVSTLQTEIRANLDHVTHLLAPVAKQLLTKSAAEYHRLESMLQQLIHHPSN